MIRTRVAAARQRQQVRFSNFKSSNVIANADMRVGDVRLYCTLRSGRSGGELDPRGDGTDVLIRERLSSCAQAGAHDRTPGRVRADPGDVFGTGASINSEGDDRR